MSPDRLALDSGRLKNPVRVVQFEPREPVEFWVETLLAVPVLGNTSGRGPVGDIGCI